MIDAAAIGFALGAGGVAALNPCGFAFLPGYLGLVIAGENRPTSQLSALGRAGTATVAMSAGFVTVFGLFGLVVSPLIASAQRYLPFATVVVGVLLVATGVWLSCGRDVSILLPKFAGGTPTARLRSMYAYGVAYAIASLSCTVAPFLAMISTTFRRGDLVAGILSFLLYAAGMALVVGVAALVVALAGSTATGMFRRMLPYITRIGGAVVLLTGLYVTYYGIYEIRLYFSDGSADDPVVEAAGAVQGWLARGVDAVGAWPLVGVVVVIVAGAVAWHVFNRRRRQRGDGRAHPSSSTEARDPV